MEKPSKKELEAINRMLSENPVTISLHFKDGYINMNYDSFVKLMNKEQ